MLLTNREKQDIFMELNLGLKCYSGYSFPLSQESQIKVNSFSFVSTGTLVRTHPSQSWSKKGHLYCINKQSHLLLLLFLVYLGQEIMSLFNKPGVRSDFFYTKGGGGKVKHFLYLVSFWRGGANFFLPVVIHRWTWSDIRKVKNTAYTSNRI